MAAFGMFLIDHKSVCSPKIAAEEEKLEHSYANLKGLCEERKQRLEQAVELFKLNRDVDDLEIWINEREIVAGSHEMGQDLEHVIVSCHINLPS